MSDSELAQRIRALEVAMTRLPEAPGLWLNFVTRDAITPVATTPVVPFVAGIPRPTIYPVVLRIWFYVATTNSAINFWTINARTVATANIAQIATSADAANAWTFREDTTFSAASYTESADKVIDIVCTKTGTPGALYVVPMLYVL